MGYNKENYKRIRAEYETKSLRAQQLADERRRELYLAIPELKDLDLQLSQFGLRILQTAMHQKNTDDAIEKLRIENQRITAQRAQLLKSHGYAADYSEPRYECDLCKDVGYVGIKMCSCMRNRLIEAGMASSGLAALMKKQSFENFSLDYYKQNPKDYEIMRAVLQTLRNYASEFSIGTEAPASASLLLWGGTGLGKTHLSTAIAGKVIERGYDVYYNSAVGMLSDFEQRRFGNGLISGEGSSDDTARYVECDLLILDDLGTEVVNQFTVSCLYHVINTRLNLQKPTIVSTNLSIAELRKIYNDRITSRLTGEFQMVPFYGTDVRRQKLQNH